MDRCALFVDAGYLLADGAMAVHGTRHREAVSWDFGGLLQLLGNLARERTGMPLLRCYWYEATVEGRRGTEHEALADLPGLKLRLGRVRPGRREGVDTEIHRDLMTLARNSAVADAIVVSGDEDLVQIISDAQDLGVRVTVVHVAVDGNWTISRSLRQECDDLIEIGSSHLRPYVNLLAGLDTGSSSPLSNGHGNGHGNGSTGSNGVIAPLRTAPHTSPPPSSPLTPAPLSAPSLAGSGLSQSGQQPASLSGFPSRLGQTQPQSHGQSHAQSHTQGQSQSTSQAQVPAQRSLSSTGTSSTGMSGAGLGSTTGSGALSGYLPGAPGNLSTGGSSLPGQAGHLQATRSPMQHSSGGIGGGAGMGSSGMGSTGMRLPSDGGGSGGGAQYSVSPAVPQQSSNPYGMGGGGGQLAPVPQQQQQQQGSPSLSDAVKAAHQEGQDFGESVARDAPALWLEAVLARKPRMPSDLEARLLQGSSLPIDYLLHDEVRHALRRGFWDALECSRR